MKCEKAPTFTATYFNKEDVSRNILKLRGAGGLSGISADKLTRWLLRHKDASHNL